MNAGCFHDYSHSPNTWPGQISKEHASRKWNTICPFLQAPQIFTGDVLGAPTSPHPTPSWRGERYTFSFPQQEKQGNTYPKGLHALRLPALITFPPCVLSSQSNELPTQWEVSKVTREVPPLRKVRLGDGVHFGLLSLECGLFGTSSSTFWSL